MKIAYRFLCHEVRKGPTYEQIILQPVYSKDPANPNHAWSQASPSGKFEVTITNPLAWGAYVPGVEYDLFSVPAPKPAETLA